MTGQYFTTKSIILIIIYQNPEGELYQQIVDNLCSKLSVEPTTFSVFSLDTLSAGRRMSSFHFKNIFIERNNQFERQLARPSRVDSPPPVGDATVQPCVLPL